MITFLEWIGAIGGVGAVFAVLLFFVYWRTTKQMREDRKYMEDRLSDLLEKDQETREDNTKALSELTTLLIRMNGKAK